MEPDQRHKKDDIGSRLLNRVSSVFRRGSRRTKSTTSTTDIKEPKRPEITPPTASAPATATDPTDVVLPATFVTAPARDTTHVVQWSEIQQERARTLFAKYGLSLEPQEWMSPCNLEVQRVERSVRMRVRRTCHRCQTTYGSDRVCVNCQHVRCKKCPRYPPARTKEEKEARALAKAEGKEPERPTDTTVAAPVAATIAKIKQNSAPLTMTSRTGGQDLTYKPIRQRVRRTCHQCQTLFQGNATECECCGHSRCKICPRDPPKRDKYPDGYPNDKDPPIERPARVWKKPRMRVRYFCYKCDQLYQPGQTKCASCGEEKGPNTRRDPPKKERPPIDPDLLRRVQQRLDALRVDAPNDT